MRILQVQTGRQPWCLCWQGSDAPLHMLTARMLVGGQQGFCRRCCWPGNLLPLKAVQVPEYWKRWHLVIAKAAFSLGSNDILLSMKSTWCLLRP